MTVMNVTPRWSRRYNACTKSEGAVVRSPLNQPKNIFSKGYYANHLLHIYFTTFPGAKSSGVSKGITIGFEMAEKKVYKHANKKTDISYLYKQIYKR